VLQRLLVTLGILVIIRLGYFIPVPGVDLGSLPAAAYGMEGERLGGSSSSSSSNGGSGGGGGGSSSSPRTRDR
jgi:preprotein translocase subunit SecY